MQTTTLITSLSNTRLYQTRYRKIDKEMTLSKMELRKMNNIYDAHDIGNTT